MTRSVWRWQEALWFLALLADPEVLMAQSDYFIEPGISLSADVVFLKPIVRSFASATLFNKNGARVYQQIILGHDVADEGSVLLFHSTIDNPNGYVNSRTGDMDGSFDRCYQARMGAHANDFNLHVTAYSSTQCIPPIDEVPEVEVPKENCPVLLDLEQNGFHLSGTDNSVDFDIDADGSSDSIAWTQAGEDDAFLCLDRNGNGVIDDGTELFGYATPLLSGKRAKVGYRALAEFDERELGGNRDGKVDGADPLFHSLCAWVDSNRDGISQPAEIYALDDVGIVALEYAYRPTQIIDSFGNLFRYASRAAVRTSSGSVTSWPTFDVIFAEP